MNPRGLINFFRTPIGAFAAFCALVITALVVAHHFQKPKPALLVNSASAAQSPEIVESVLRNMQPYHPPGLQNASFATKSGAERKQKLPTLPPISLYNQVQSAKTKHLSQLYAPFGRLIPCELVITVDSSTIRTPIIGLVTEDVYFGGHLIIPAGTEVHGVAEVDRERERIASGDRWTLVMQDGEELTLTGIALDRQTDTNGVGWDIMDGSAGLRGQLIKSDDMAEIKLFAASFLSAAAAELNQNQQTIVGYQLIPNTQNAALAGAQGVLGAYANQIFDSIQRDGFYVRVPAGKEFYLYVTQTIDRNDAAIGESRSDSNGINNPLPQPAAQPQARIPHHFNHVTHINHTAMKAYFLVPIVILTGCGSPRVIQMPPQPSTALSPEQAESVRYAETVKAYPIGRYIDPNNDLIMHGAHTIYRVETTARWNLHPDALVDASLGPPVAMIDPAKYNAPVNAEIIAEVFKQKMATEALLERNGEFNQSLSQMGRAVQAIHQVDAQNRQLQQELSMTERRLDALEDQLRNKQADSFGVNENTNTNQW